MKKYLFSLLALIGLSISAFGQTNVPVTLNTKGYATYSCQYDVVVSTADVKVYIASADATTITIREIGADKYIKAGTGVLLFGEAGKTVNFSTDVTGKTKADVTGNVFKATTNKSGGLNTLDDDDDVCYALGTEDKFLRYTGASFIHNRAFIERSTVYTKGGSAAPSLNIVFDDDATAIGAIIGATKSEGKFIENGRLVIKKSGVKYNAQGQMVK